ncbi:MAG: 2-amino-4-hydroxy-6-hydroxymethyldihydropteridine diphosphokinase [Rhodospirillaceae bacterium]|nr:2-amino-4-hydroxy-6-hydroxymethyldihydropteridine diphosphokinase [Rhodospirillaceae bacterium]
MILIGIGGNLASPVGDPMTTGKAALARLGVVGVACLACSPWYESTPVPPSDQPWFINAVAQVSTALGPAELLAALHGVEDEFGRQRAVANAARTLDFDLLAYGDLVREEPPLLPHPRLHQRAFVLLPLRDLVPAWRHPVFGLTPAELIERLPPGADLGAIVRNAQIARPRPPIEL